MTRVHYYELIERSISDKDRDEGRYVGFAKEGGGLLLRTRKERPPALPSTESAKSWAITPCAT